MAQNGIGAVSDHHRQPHFFEKVAKTVKAATVCGATALFSPVLIMFIPMWVPVFFVYWMYSYLTGQHPVRAVHVDQAREKIVKRVEEVKNKVKPLGKDITKVDR
ncbi:hypothetical protein SSX86_012142 [Deinandra increscens subsp. villosa]|uniref:Oleosin n=1 Tax=Deinandra increscens subsp. villosa TaxID=3103831 RepID=A0AAP0D5B0_9ASTR